MNNSDEVLIVVNQDISHLGFRAEGGPAERLYDVCMIIEPPNKALRNERFAKQLLKLIIQAGILSTSSQEHDR